jgi:hypothetical protein
MVRGVDTKNKQYPTLPYSIRGNLPLKGDSWKELILLLELLIPMSLYIRS